MTANHYPPLIEARQISHQFDQGVLLNDISLTISQGEYVAILGLNGSGKSTLLRLLLGLMPPSQGHIKHCDALRIGYVPQRWHPDVTLPMHAHALLSLSLTKQDKNTQRRIQELLNAWEISHLAYQPLHTLSGGQWQRVLMARALINEPNILALDEPTQGVDLPGQHAFYQRLERLHQQGYTILMISHDIAHAMSYSQRVIALSEGRICCQGDPKTVLNSHAYQQRFVCAHQHPSTQCQGHHHA